MGIKESIKGQFIDVIEYIDENNQTIVKKYVRVKDDNEIKWGAKLIVHEGQIAIFLKDGVLTDIFEPGKYTLSTENLPLLSKIAAIPYGLNSPIKADIFFVSTKQFINNNWGTKNPVIMRDKEFDIVRVRAFGNYAFKIVKPDIFMKEVFGTQKKVETNEIIDYLMSFVGEAFAIVMAEIEISILDLAKNYANIGRKIQEKINEKAHTIGVEFSNINIENISLPEEVEKVIDERSSMGVIKDNMKEYAKFQSIQAMRDAAKQESGMAGIGASLILGNEMLKDVKETTKQEENKKIECTECGALIERTAKFCSNCGAKLNKKEFCSNCGKKLNSGEKFCSECGTKR